LGQDHIARVKA